MTHQWMRVPPGGGGDYVVCSHQGCTKKARRLTPADSHDCCGKHDRWVRMGRASVLRRCGPAHT